MKTCENCFWRDRCTDAGKRCEYYEPIYGYENIAIREYKQSLEERDEDYASIVREQRKLER